MTSFALITEGITDQVVITAILHANYDEEPDINEVQPIRDETDNSRQGNLAGWEKVLEYCGLEFFQKDFIFNDYVIIQIDTDVAEHENFGIPLTENGVDIPTDTLIENTKEMIANKIGKDIYEKYKERIIFAISVHSIECWLLPFFINEKKGASRVKNCEYHLTRALTKKRIPYAKNFECYENLAKYFSKKNLFSLAESRNESLRIFISSLP
ncbi:hypothetical protein ACWYXK_18970 [Janthinobacterium lividum]